MAIETYDQLGNLVKRDGISTVGAGRGIALDPRRIDLPKDFNDKNTTNNGPYGHDTNKLSPSESSQYRLEFQPNILDYYDQHTYHWKLFITSTEDAASGNVLDESKQVIIAESGVSDLTIDKVEFSGIIVPSAEGGTGTQTTINFEIVEPSGAGLLDKIYYQSLALGIGNWMTMPVFIQLEFRGRDPETSNAVLSDSQNGIGALKWVWPITMTKADAHVSEVGTRYAFSCILYSELAQTNTNFSLPYNTVLDELTTFDNAMKLLESKLNADQYERLVGDCSIPNTYKIIVDPELKSIPLVLSDDNKSTAFGRDFIDFNKKTASFSAGTGIDRIIDALLGNTDTFQREMPGAKSRAGTPATAKTIPDQMKKLWRVVTDTLPLGYDQLQETNALAITIYVVKYDIGILDISASQTGQTPDTISSSKKRVIEYIDKHILRKKYNYIFTGLNDQIVKFDLEINMATALVMPRYGGQFADSFTQQPGVSRPKDKADIEKNIADQVRKSLRFVHESTSERASQNKINDTKKAIANASASLDPAVVAKYNTLLDHAKPAQKQVFINEITTSGGMTRDGAVDASYVNYKEQLAYFNSSLTPYVKGHKFISDVDLSPATTNGLLNLVASNRGGKMRPLAIIEGDTDTANSTGMDPTSDAARARTSSIFAYALYSGMGASLQKVELTIKGDPFWLFPRQLGADTKIFPHLSLKSESEAISEIKNSHKTDPTSVTTSVNVFGTDNFIVLRFRTPRLFNDTTGVTDPFTEVETFSGIYKVTTIVSKFQMGKFVQVLTCIIDPAINLSEIPDILNNKIETSNAGKDPTLTELMAKFPTSSTKAPSKLKVPGNENGFDYTDGQTKITKDTHTGPGTGRSSKNI